MERPSLTLKVKKIRNKNYEIHTQVTFGSERQEMEFINMMENRSLNSLSQMLNSKQTRWVKTIKSKLYNSEINLC
jgi:hypothetical protein